MKNISGILCAVITFTMIGCKKESASQISTPGASFDVYVAGSVSDYGQGYDVCYWKNGVKVYLHYRL